MHFYCKYCIFIALLLQNSTIDCFKKDQPVTDRILPLSNYMLYFFFPNMLDALWRKFNQSNPNFCEEYAVYHHFRSKGWVVKDGTKFGVEFLLYQEGPAYFHAQYSVKIVSENSPMMTWKTLSELNRVTESSSKELLLAEISNCDISPECSELKNIGEMRKESSKIIQKLLNVRVTENIVKRWVPNQERDQN